MHQAWDLAGSGASDELGCSLVLPTPRMAVLQTTLSNRAFIFFWLIRPPAKARKACFSASRGGLLAVRSGVRGSQTCGFDSALLRPSSAAAFSCIRQHLVERTSLELPRHPLLETRGLEQRQVTNNTTCTTERSAGVQKLARHGTNSQLHAIEFSTAYCTENKSKACTPSTRPI